MHTKTHPLLIVNGVLAFALAVGCALVALLAQGGRFVRVLDVPTHFAPIWLTIGLLASLAAAMSWPSRLLAGSGLTGLIIGLSAASMMGPDLRAASVPPAPMSNHRLKIVQFNVWDGNTDPNGTAAWILQQKADVVVLQEARGDGVPILKALDKTYPYRQACPAAPWCSAVILTRVKPLASGGLAESPATGGVAANWVRLRLAGGPVTIVGTHLARPYPLENQQDIQIRALTGLVRRFPQATTIVAGDFNLSSTSYTLQAMESGFGLERLTHATATWPARGNWQIKVDYMPPFLAIDHIFAGSDWRVVSLTRGPRLASDHYPLVAVLTRD